jgi:hypothetical protein
MLGVEICLADEGEATECSTEGCGREIRTSIVHYKDGEACCKRCLARLIRGLATQPFIDSVTPSSRRTERKGHPGVRGSL